MSTLPEIFSQPVFGNIGSGTVDWPTLGAVLAWLLIAALVGSFLGLLRTGMRARPAATHPASDDRSNTGMFHGGLYVDRAHRHAA